LQIKHQKSKIHLMSEHLHHHSHHHHQEDVGKLKIALVLTAIYMLAEAFGGWWVNSLALLADAGHMLTDVGALALTLFAFRFATRPATPSKTYGYHRLEILAAFVNGITLVLISIFIIYEAYERLLSPPEVKGFEMTLIAVGGLLVNLICAGLLHSNHHHNLNMHGAWLHLIGDALGSVAAIVASLLISFFGFYWADAVCSVLISLIIIWGAWNLIKESVNVLLEGTPAHLNITSLRETILQIENVVSVHDLHAWTITSGKHSFSAHVVYRQEANQSRILAEIHRQMRQKFDISHLTIQMETVDFQDCNESACIGFGEKC
jgi:cobalt-zinc-cadmium efflux system protein